AGLPYLLLSSPNGARPAGLTPAGLPSTTVSRRAPPRPRYRRRRWRPVRRAGRGESPAIAFRRAAARGREARGAGLGSRRIREARELGRLRRLPAANAVRHESEAARCQWLSRAA